MPVCSLVYFVEEVLVLWYVACRFVDWALQLVFSDYVWNLFDPIPPICVSVLPEFVGEVAVVSIRGGILLIRVVYVSVEV